jgi:hypothetical protein
MTRIDEQQLRTALNAVVTGASGMGSSRRSLVKAGAATLGAGAAAIAMMQFDGPALAQEPPDGTPPDGGAGGPGGAPPDGGQGAAKAAAKPLTRLLA